MSLYADMFLKKAHRYSTFGKLPMQEHSPHKKLEFQRAQSLGEVMIKDFTIQLEPVILTTEQR